MIQNVIKYKVSTAILICLIAASTCLCLYSCDYKTEFSTDSFSFTYELEENETDGQYCLNVSVLTTNIYKDFNYTGAKHDLFGPAKIVSADSDETIAVSVETPSTTDATKRVWHKDEQCQKEYTFKLSEPLPDGTYKMRFSIGADNCSVLNELLIETKQPIYKKG